MSSSLRRLKLTPPSGGVYLGHVVLTEKTETHAAIIFFASSDVSLHEIIPPAL
jgi:hypothetical protein